ncbi:hypothetical protein L1887_57795 [Cichorium endivia]|nr:hypothetical protein L1887_57795 [Cichorium endivia]
MHHHPIESRKSSQSCQSLLCLDLACFEHSNFFKVTAPEARPGQLRPGAHRRQKGRTGITAAAGTRLALQWILVKGLRLYSFQLPDSFEPGIVIYCHYLPVSGLGNLRACCLPWMVVAVSQAPSPESNPNSPSPVTTIVGHYPTIES